MASNGCCLEWEQELMLFLDNELSSNRRSRVEKHVLHCSSCARFSHELQREELLLAGHLQHEVQEPVAGPVLTERVMQAIPHTATQRFRWRMTESFVDFSHFLLAEGRWHVAVALSILICVVGTLAVLRVSDVEADRFVALKLNGKMYPTKLQENLYVDNPKGDFFEFSDGSIVYATHGSWFILDSYPKEHDASTVGVERQLELKFGELFLDVKPANEGFTVLCANSITKVFGTQFYVSLNKGDYLESIVAVRKGQVLVEKRNMTGYTVLKENEYTRVSNLGEQITMERPRTLLTPLRSRLNEFNEALANRLFETWEPQPNLYTPDGALLQ